MGQAASRGLFAAADVGREERPDGSFVLRSRQPLGPCPGSMVEVFARRAREHPERTLVAQRDADGWRSVSWGQAAAQVQALAQNLARRGAPGRPVMILSGNSIEHLLLTLAAFTAGSPAVPVSVAYSLQSSDHEKLRRIAALTGPAVVFADDADAFGPALAAVRDACQALEPAGDPALVTATGGPGTLAWRDLAAGRPGAPAGASAEASTSPDTVAKLLFTSGSTGEPKAVITTQRMLCANQQAMRQVWPFLADQPPVLLDWLPWSHTFGGSHNVGMVLYNGGSLYIDDGRPAPALINRTLRNLDDVAPTVFFNVPVGYSLLLPLLTSDPALARKFFRELRVVFYAAAALPQQVWDGLLELAGTTAGHPVAVTTSWGATETAPAATSAHFPSGRSDCIGVPLPGVEIKLVPVGAKQEIRVRGPNVTPGYYARPELTRAAFDDEGFYRTGDAGELIDPLLPERGLRFTGRMAEDFKLGTGTWVNVAAVKSALLSACGGILQDCVIAGHDREYVSAMAWLNPLTAGQLAGGEPAADGSGPGLAGDPRVRAYLAGCLAALNQGAGSSRRVARLMLLRDPPQLDAGEITDKGYLNQRACLDRRAADVTALYGPAGHPRVVLPAAPDQPAASGQPGLTVAGQPGPE